MPETDETIRDILWESLEGGTINIDELKVDLKGSSHFEEFGLDSLDMTDFFLRIQDYYKIRIRQEDYADLVSLAAVHSYVREKETLASQN